MAVVMVADDGERDQCHAGQAAHQLHVEGGSRLMVWGVGGRRLAGICTVLHGQVFVGGENGEEPVWFPLTGPYNGEVHNSTRLHVPVP